MEKLLKFVGETNKPGFEHFTSYMTLGLSFLNCEMGTDRMNQPHGYAVKRKHLA